MKRSLKLCGIIILLFIIIFSILKIREYIDAHTEFELNENKFILEYFGFPEENGRVSSNYYYEINLDEKTVDYRHDVDYFDERVTNWFERTFRNKKRKLEHRYHLNDDTVKELRNLLTEFTKSDFEMNNKEFSFGYYFIITSQGEFKISDNNRVNQILDKMKK